MDLQGGKITLAELARDPRARAVVDREFPGILGHPLAGMFLGMTVNQAMVRMKGRVPQATLQRMLKELEAL